MSEKKAPKAVLIFILGLLSSIGPISIDLYLPAFSAIASDLKTDVSSVMLSLSAFFVGISLGQLVYGPLLERFGRKKPLYGGLALYALASVGCALSESVEALNDVHFAQTLTYMKLGDFKLGLLINFNVSIYLPKKYSNNKGPQIFKLIAKGNILSIARDPKS